MKTTNIVRILCLPAGMLGLAMSVAAAQDASPYVDGINPVTGAPQRQPGVVEANGRCKGISYGTGARRCGTRTGGPAGGMSSRN